MHRVLLLVAAAALLAGCGGSSQNGDAAEASRTQTAGGTSAQTGESPDGDKGVGPITHVDVAALDMSRAGEGAELFQVKCTACHKIEEKYIGPALTGVTTRRKPEWIMNMILNPDVMVKEDETARGLLAEFLAPMTNQNLTEEEAKLLLTFLIANDTNLGE